MHEFFSNSRKKNEVSAENIPSYEQNLYININDHGRINSSRIFDLEHTILKELLGETFEQHFLHVKVRIRNPTYRLADIKYDIFKSKGKN